MRQVRRTLRWRIALLFMVLSAIIGPAPAGAAEQHSPTLTVSLIEINPSSGGPGTVVEIHGVEFYSKVDLYLGVLKRFATRPDQPIPDPNRPSFLIGTAEGQGPTGSFTFRATMPATWPSGQPIVEKDLYIGAAQGSTWFDYRRFNFTPASLPATGNEKAQDWLRLMLLACSFIATGAWIVRRERTA